MRQTLFSIPHEIAGIPVLGFGILLAFWAIGSVALLFWLGRRHGLAEAARGYLPVLVLLGAGILFVLPLLEEKDRGLPIRGYGVMMLVGVVSGVWLAARRAPAARIDPEIVFSLAFWMFAAGIAGARLFHVIEYWEESYRQPTWTATLLAIINIPKGGLVVYGSLVAVTLILPLFIWRHRVPGLALCDLIAPSMVLGLALGRIGCLLNGCCFGGPSDFSWAICFPKASLPYEVQHRLGLLHGFSMEKDPRERLLVREVFGDAARSAGLRAGDEIVEINGQQVDSSEVVNNLIDNGGFHSQAGPVDRQEVARTLMARRGPDIEILTADGRRVQWSVGALPAESLPVHPTQLYSAIDAALLCLFLLAYYPLRHRDGEVFALMLTIYPLMRFLTEMIRMDEPTQFGTGLTISQLVSLVILLFVAGLWAYLLRQPSGKLWAEIGPPIAVANKPATA